MPNPKIPFDNDRPPTKSELTADAARKLVEKAESLNGEFAREETQAVLKKIEETANKAQTSITATFTWQNREVIQKRLQQLGYKVEYNDGGFGQSGYYSITW